MFTNSYSSTLNIPSASDDGDLRGEDTLLNHSQDQQNTQQLDADTMQVVKDEVAREQAAGDDSQVKDAGLIKTKPGRLTGRSHPLYKTSNNSYGMKKPTEIHKHDKWHGTNGSFSKEFVGGMKRDNSLNCAKTRNPVLPDPTFGTNAWFPNSSM